MGREACVIKGNRKGLSLRIAEDAAFSVVLEQLRQKLSSAREFFSGASVQLLNEPYLLSPEQREELRAVIAEYDMVLEIQAEQQEEREAKKQPEAEDTLLIRRTIRSGQQIHHPGNVVVLGDVNPGAEIVCGGDILVLGSLRGVAHAGARGNTEAVVFAFRLEPTQLRIAHYISRAPDETQQPTRPEIAGVVDHLIQIREYSH